MRNSADLITRLRDRIVSGLHLGRLHSGDRLPSIREVAAEAGINDRTVARAYRTLEAEGLVEVRGRSGVYVAEQDRLDEEVLPETVRWMAGVLSEARMRGISIPKYHDFVRQCTVSVRVRCACVESTEDSMVAFCTELEQEWGFDVQTVLLDTEDPRGGRFDEETSRKHLREALADVDLVATSSFNAGVVRSVAEALGKPFVTLTTHPELRAAILRHLEQGELTVVVADARFGARVRMIYGDEPGRADRIRVVLADEQDAVAGLDPEKPVLLTRAARERLGDSHFDRLLPHSPTISPESDRELAELLIRFNREKPSSGLLTKRKI